MLKRLLAFTLAGCLVFDTAAVTGYAAETGAGTAVGSVMETDASGTVDGGDGFAGFDEKRNDPDAAAAAGAVGLPFTKNEDGSYSFENETYRITVLPEAGYRFLRHGVSMEAKDGQTLSGNFNVIGYYRESGSDTEAKGSAQLASWNSYSWTWSDKVESGKSYEVYYVLQDAAGSVLATSEKLVLETEKTDKSFILHGITQTETSIILDVEMADFGKCFYAPVDDPDAEQNRTLSFGWQKVELSGLQPGTEYNIQFVKSSTTSLLFETKAATEPTSTEIVWQAGAAASEFGIEVKADISKYAGDATSAVLYYVYTNALGEKKESRQWMYFSADNVTVAEDGTKSFSISSTLNEGLLADTEYEVIMWVELGDAVYGKTTRKVTTPQALCSADDIEFAVGQREGDPKTIECRITKKNTTVTSMKAQLYYRREGDIDAYKKQSAILGSTPQTIYLSQLEYGAAYHYVLFAGGIMKELTQTFGAPEIKLTAVGEGQVNAFDFVRTWKAESTEGAEALSDNYYLSLYYYDNNSYKQMTSMVLNAENNYQVEFQTASNRLLLPDTDYELKWILGRTASAGTYDAALCTVYETVHTRKAEFTMEDQGDTGYDSRRIKVSLEESDAVNLSENNRSLYLYGWIRKAGAGTFRQTGNSMTLSGGNSFSASISFSGLEAGTTYEFSLRDSSTGYSTSVEYLSGTFTTPKDERTITITGVDAKLHGATLNYALSGILPIESHYGYISCYVREKSEGSQWEKAGYDRSYSGTSGHTGNYEIASYNNGAALKDNTTYEYQIGFAASYNASLSELRHIVAGEFATPEDKRSLSGAGASAGYTTAQIGAMFSGNEYNVSSWINLFYREKGTEAWSQEPSWYTGQVSVEFSRMIEGLEPGTEYEYVMVIADSVSCSGPEAVTVDSRKLAGEFTTRKSEYTLGFAADESKLTHNRAVVAVSAGGSDADERLEVALELNNGLSGNTAEVVLKRSSGYTRNVTFTDLLGGTEYTITRATLSVTENNTRVTIAELPCDFKFTTKAAQAPASISLLQEKIGLNVANTNQTAYEGYNQITLKVNMEPGTAAADFIWESSNPEVASVRNGVVSAKGVGEARITVKSAYDETVTASCDVTVKNYVIGYAAQAGAVPDIYYYYSRGSVYKGGYVDGLGLYEQNEDGSLTLVPDAEVTFDRSGIVTWDSAAGRLQTQTVGTVRLQMQKNQVKASFPLTVTAAGKGFGITGFTSGSSAYPAVAGDTEDSYVLACVSGTDYTAVGEISPVQPFDPLDFTWKISDESVAAVSEYGVVTPVKAGDVTLTVTPNRFQTLQGSPYIQQTVTLTLHIRELPVRDVESIYALANTAVKIGDVPFPDTWGEGWSWKYPDTPLVTNGVYTDNRYEFEAVYRDQKSGTDGRYPCEARLRVYIGRITGLSVREETEGISHNGVLEITDQTGAADILSLRVRPISQGTVSADSYVIEIPEVSGLTIAKNEKTGCFDITSGKAGSYTLKPVIKDKNTQKVLAQSSYKIKVMAQKQAADIQISVAENSGEGVTIDKTGTIIFNSVDDKKDFVLQAKVKGRDGQETDTAIVWKSSDKSVASIAAASKQDSHTAKVSVKGEGHTVLTAVAKDARGFSVSVNLEVRNHRPRVNTAKATVNIAYDYENSYGRSYAKAAGTVEIVPVYGESIGNVRICDENGQESALLQAEFTDSYNYLIKPAASQISTGNYECKLIVTTDSGTEYTYPLKVSVVDKAPAVSAKMGTVPDLFFTDSTGRINLTIGDNRFVESVTWEDQSQGVNNGFSMQSYYYTDKGKYVSYIRAEQQSGLRVTAGKLDDPGVVQGTLSVKVRGYRKTYTFENFKIKYAYKKPSVVTMSASSNVAPAIGQNQGWFRFYDKTNKRYLYYEEEASAGRYYDELTWSSEEVELYPSGTDVDYRYLGSAGIKKLTMTLDSLRWREPLQAVHAIKVIKPQAYLNISQITFNTAAKSTASVYVNLKNMGYNISYKDITIEGANAASKKLLDNDLFLITASNRTVTVSMSDAKLMGDKIPAGSYKFKLTPYCENAETGERTALNTLTLTVKVVDKPVTAKVSPKGSLDLTYGVSSIPEEKKNYYVLADPKFSNKADGYNVVGYRLVGEYSDYFQLNYGYIRYANKWGYHYYIGIADRSLCKLKAGQTYKLAVEYTFKGEDGEIFTVTSNTFKIKPKQTAAKVTVQNNNQTMYAGANTNLTRSCYLSVPSYYSVASAYGSIDCNKDGRADITVSGSGSSLTIRIVDADAVGATASGKAYSIPVTVRLRGRDGVGKDAKVTVKVKVKR